MRSGLSKSALLQNKIRSCFQRIGTGIAKLSMSTFSPPGMKLLPRRSVIRNAAEQPGENKKRLSLLLGGIK